ncbi:rod shape-determining protein MreC [Erythrobacter rubeus]|uniref:Cell shape-determining protein MreC n=1 Tax=Erythrobacter rubeus TaxID=2760803 RepID=A0ABR8KMQ4_9SPHN|nr:rod shape-determining protein MreC [Erythrobacter rubeus]MBD2841854.1 rod shape-determining protein MreC [Erythrobacter rubeus]
MAPPSSRRSSGFSKRAQYSVFTGYVLAALGAVLGLALLALSLWQPPALAPLRGGANDVVSPVGEGTAAVRSTSNDVWDTISAFWNAGRQNAALREEVEIARIRLEEAKAVEQENERLKSLVALSESQIEPVAVARLVGSTATSSRRFAYIGKGRSEGIEVGMPVRSARGVVGRVLEVARRSSRILLLTDTESVLPVRRSTDETVAFAEGRGDGLLRIRLINLGLNPLEVGDVFVTSGTGGYYRPGVAVGVLSELTPDGGIARLIADPSATDFVSIEPIYEEAATDSALVPTETTLEEAESDR